MWTFPPLSDPSIGMVTIRTRWKPTGMYTGICWPIDIFRFLSLSLRGPNIMLPANPNLEPRPWVPQTNHFVREMEKMGKMKTLLHRYHAIALLSSMDCSGFRTWRLFLIVMDRPNCLCTCLTCFSVPMSRDSRTMVVIFAIDEVLGQLLTSPTCCLSLESNVRIDHVAFFMESVDIKISLVAFLYRNLLLHCSSPALLLYCTTGSSTLWILSSVTPAFRSSSFFV